ncbi:hypothetical protein L6164_002354 [Bauhinia variegata]|uniref:Uncharacterized protein n=1 Tax=Bauhinia variegata TaxID=167791 RepID=A0ACB9Q0N0_BAUVA|nr:hypothetical protein L6164_002354 [Bauhinia variegata]
MRMQLVSWFSFILCYCLYLNVNIFGMSSQCLVDQQTLLLKLKDSLAFKPGNSSKLVSWNQSLDCCLWNGVTCNGEGSVIGLDLSGEMISGGINNTSSIFSLQNLQILNLSNNNFSSEIPSEFNKLTNLTLLNLSFASFAGQIPMEISQLTRLVTLDISSLSYLTGKELKLENPNLQKLVQNLTRLRQLYLDGVSISAQGQEWCNALLKLKSLQELSMSNCNLSGPIDSSLASLKKLSVIRLDQNNLSSTVPEFFANFTNLTTLHLTSCGLSGMFPPSIFQVVTLTSIDITYNTGLHGYLPDFPLNGSLKTLVVSNTNFSGPFPYSISNLRQLTKLDFSKCQFGGTLASSMSNLTELTYVDLSNNNFTGPIPSFNRSRYLTHLDLSHNDLKGGILSAHLEDLPDLVYIDLRYNSLSGSIPSSLFSLPLLQKIQLSYNNFDGQLVEFSNSSSSALDTLDLSSNNLTGPIPSSIFNLRNLSILQLSSNQLNGSIKLEMFRRLLNLTTLDISYNNLSLDANVTDSPLSSFPNISTLKLSSCKLREFPLFLRNQYKLTNLDLSNNQIQGKIPKWIWELQFLGSLNLSNNCLVGLEGPLQTLTTILSVLDLHSNKLEGQIPALPPSVTYLDLSNNKFSSVTPPDVGTNLNAIIFLSLSNNSVHGSIPLFLCNASSLQVLDLSDNNFDGTIPDCLTKSESLAVLNLRNNSLHGSIPDTFPASCVLKTLDIRQNLLGGMIPKSLANCTMLEVLDLGKNKIMGGFPCLLKKISTLRVLVLRENHFHGQIGCPAGNSTWHNLQIVDIAFNNFTGMLPGRCFNTWKAMMLNEDRAISETNHLRFEVLQYGKVYYQDSVTVTTKGQTMNLVKILTVFTSIDFSSNQFEGSIPEEMMNFRALYALNLSNNALSGQIPSSIGNLKDLESLDMSNNSLEGEIPTQLASLTFLSFLNLSYNHLVGKIPTGTQLQSFEAASFIGNEKLCGPPLSKYCSESTKVGYKDSEAKFDWQFISTGVGFGFGAGLVVAPLMFWERGRKWINNSIDKILLVFFAMFGLVYTPIDDDEENGEDTEEQDAKKREDLYYNEDEDNSDYLDEFQGQYCVFCSKLDINMKKVIHDPTCTCHFSPPISTSASSSASFSP